MNKKLFKFVEGHPDDGPGITQVKTIGGGQLSTASEMVAPVAPGQYIDIVKDFKWTKTGRNSEGRKNTPAIELEEYYVTEPAFWSNLKTVFETFKGGTSQAMAIAEKLLPQSVTSVLSGARQSVQNFGTGLSSSSPFNTDKSIAKWAAAIREDLGLPQNDLPDSTIGPSYLKSYEDTYGVKRTKFKYKLPYLENSYKNIKTQWGDGTTLHREFLGSGMDFIQTMMSIASPGVGIDWTKSFSYDSTPPRHTIKFFLDNTKDSNYSGSPDVQVKDSSLKSNYDLNVGLAATHIPNYETNFRFIFLLLYQNLPNRLNKAAIAPPVIYRAKLPGVFSYRYCFFDNITVDMVGVRKTKEINMFNNGPSNVVIPEGYEIQLNLQSLVPESQNLYYDAIANPVVSSVYGDI